MNNATTAPISPSALNDIQFWLGQDMEHHMFFTLGLVDDALKNRSAAIFQQYAALLKQGPSGALQAYQTVLPAAQTLKQDILSALSQGKWIGWIYPAFVDHAKREMDYLNLRITPNGLRPRDELCTINRFNGDELGLNGHLLDPSYDFQVGSPLAQVQQKEAIARGLEAQCTQTPYEQLLAATKASTMDILAFLHNTDVTKLKSIINPLLAQHALRERQWFASALSMLPATAQ